jgi:hypothetical protein
MRNYWLVNGVIIDVTKRYVAIAGEEELIEYLESKPVKWHVERHLNTETVGSCSIYFSFRKDADAIEYMLRFGDREDNI